MTANITDVDIFTDPIVVPVDGEPDDQAAFALAPQGLANRTRNLKNRVDAGSEYARYGVAFSGSVLDGLATLSASSEGASSGFSLSGGNAVVFPSVGRYLVTVSVDLTEDTSTTNPFNIRVDVTLGPSTIVTYTTLKSTSPRWSATTTHSVPVSIAGIVEVTNIAHTLSVVNRTTGSDISTSGGVGALSIVRIDA